MVLDVTRRGAINTERPHGIVILVYQFAHVGKAEYGHAVLLAVAWA